MGSRTGLFVLFGVLLVVTVAPLCAAGPRLLTDPGADSAKDMAEDGQRNAQDRAAGAQNQVGQAQATAEQAAQDGTAAADGALVQAKTALSALVTEAQRVADRVGAQVLCMVFLCSSNEMHDEDWGPRSVSSQSSTIAPVEGGLGFGIALVVAASAVGGALVWLTILQRGVIVGALPLLSRIAHSEIYTNDARRLIAQIASENPGLCLNDIVSRTGYSRNAVSYHLFVLEKEEELISVKDGKYRRYFPRGGKYVNGAKQVVSVLRNDTTLKMAQHIVTNPGTIQRELCQVLGTTASAACWHAKRLEQLGVIRKERVANTVRYFPGDELGRHDYSEFGLLQAAAAPMTP